MSASQSLLLYGGHVLTMADSGPAVVREAEVLLDGG